MKYAVILALAAAATTYVAVLITRLVTNDATRLRAVRRWAWLVATAVIFILVLYVAHLSSLFSLPLVALAFLGLAIPGRLLLPATRKYRQRVAVSASDVRANRPGPARFLARHEIVVALVLVCAAALIAAILGLLLGLMM